MVLVWLMISFSFSHIDAFRSNLDIASLKYTFLLFMSPNLVMGVT